MDGKMTQGGYEILNESIIEAVRTANNIVRNAEIKADDELYKGLVQSIRGILLKLETLMMVINELSLPLYPGKHKSAIDLIQKELKKGPMDYDEVTALLKRHQVSYESAQYIIEMLDKGDHIEFKDGKYTLTEYRKVKSSKYRDEFTGELIWKEAEKAIRKLVEEYGMELVDMTVNMPYDGDIWILLRVDDNLKIDDVINLRERISEEFESMVEIGFDWGGKYIVL